MAFPAASLPEPGRAHDGVEPAVEWVGDRDAAAAFGSPEAIRAGLLPEQQAEFDAAFDAALTAARQTLRLEQLQHVLRGWRRVAWLTRQDPDAQRRTVAAAAEITRTGRPRTGSVSWTDLRADLGV
ncbi:DUF6247 family protein [Actinokineospora sp. PR83]|uniref:DUF6247 family protein n=1 Tax=Actinokineospora sp. PR83 TaxID=2884908 RepID=UPI001F364AAC|nr:DUF6247 family protein [Actinokineospora sp. PR83]MCG8920287.1 DUF6247 family protein [Actinokineospora sp. PR83]